MFEHFAEKLKLYGSSLKVSVEGRNEASSIGRKIRELEEMLREVYGSLGETLYEQLQDQVPESCKDLFAETADILAQIAEQKRKLEESRESVEEKKKEISSRRAELEAQEREEAARRKEEAAKRKAEEEEERRRLEEEEAAEFAAIDEEIAAAEETDEGAKECTAKTVETEEASGAEEVSEEVAEPVAVDEQDTEPAEVEAGEFFDAPEFKKPVHEEAVEAMAISLQEVIREKSDSPFAAEPVSSDSPFEVPENAASDGDAADVSDGERELTE